MILPLKGGVQGFPSGAQMGGKKKLIEILICYSPEISKIDKWGFWKPPVTGRVDLVQFQYICNDFTELIPVQVERHFDASTFWC